MPGDVEMNEVATTVLNDYEYVQEPKSCGDGNEEVTGNESPRVKA